MDITITLNHDEIKEAVLAHLTKHDVGVEGKEIDFNLVAGRGSAGGSAVIAIKGDLPVITAAAIDTKVLAPEAPQVKAPAKKGKDVTPVTVGETKQTKAPVENLFGNESAEVSAQAIADAAAAKAAEAASLPPEENLFGTPPVSEAEAPAEVEEEAVKEEELSLFNA